MYLLLRSQNDAGVVFCSSSHSSRLESTWIPNWHAGRLFSGIKSYHCLPLSGTDSLTHYCNKGPVADTWMMWLWLSRKINQCYSMILLFIGELRWVPTTVWSIDGNIIFNWHSNWGWSINVFDTTLDLAFILTWSAKLTYAMGKPLESVFFDMKTSRQEEKTCKKRMNWARMYFLPLKS